MKELLVEFVLDSDPFFNEKCLNISHCLASVFSVPFLPEEMRTMETILALRGVFAIFIAAVSSPPGCSYFFNPRIIIVRRHKYILAC